MYIGGITRTCAQPQLTASWVASVSALKWRLLPIYKGLQPPCGGRPTDAKISRASATAKGQGTAAAADAVAKGKALGMQPGSAFYNDIEAYSQTDATCRTGVLSFLSGWTKELHRLGYVSGVYMNLNLGAKQLSDVYTSTSYARPDALWIARFDSVDSLKGWTNIADSKWAVHQRAKQFKGDHDETYGGVTLNIDTDRLDAPVATVAYTYTATSATTLNARTGPSTSYPVAKTYAPRSALKVVCQAPGSAVGTTPIWDKLADGTYVTDYYVSTPSNTTYSAPLPRCTYPYQTTATVAEHTGPGTSSSIAWHVPQRGAGVGGLPEVGLGGRHDEDMGPPRERPLCHGLLRGEPQQHDLQQTGSPLLSEGPSGSFGQLQAVVPDAHVGRTGSPTASDPCCTTAAFMPKLTLFSYSGSRRYVARVRIGSGPARRPVSWSTSGTLHRIALTAYARCTVPISRRRISSSACGSAQPSRMMFARKRSIGTGAAPRAVIRAFRPSSEAWEATSTACASAKPTLPGVSPHPSRSKSEGTRTSRDFAPSTCENHSAAASP